MKKLPDADAVEKQAYLQGFRKIFVIKGNSMLPNLKSGDCVIFNPELNPEIGDIILFHHPFIQNLKVVKRVSEITLEGNYIVRGDNSQESTDSRSYGAILAKDVLGVAVGRFDGD
ncbi:nickel-type superoxide dismutase maturation protease [soil metagenome]